MKTITGENDVLEEEKPSTIKLLFAKKYKVISTVIFIMFFGFNYGYLSFTLFMPTILKNVGIEDGTVELYATLVLQ